MTKTSATTKKNLPATGNEKKQLPANVNYAVGGPSGFEGSSREDFAIPMLRIIQRMSPQLTKSDPQYIKGAVAGMILNTATSELYAADEGILVIPGLYKRTFLEFVLRENGGGFRGEHSIEAAAAINTERDEKGREIMENGNQLVETATYGVLLLGEGGTCMPAVLTMASTQLKKARRWNTAMQQMMMKEAVDHGGAGFPMYAHVWKLTTTEEQNDKGVWDGWVIEHAGMLHEVVGEKRAQDTLTQARLFAESMRAGNVKAKYDDADH